jgi:hypothetical protein
VRVSARRGDLSVADDYFGFRLVAAAEANFICLRELAQKTRISQQSTYNKSKQKGMEAKPRVS